MKGLHLLFMTLMLTFNVNAMEKMNNLESISLGAGCFWCVEAIFQELKGVVSVESGYMGGEKLNPSYEEVCSGTTGHAEVVKVTFDPSILGVKEILEVFFQVHDPTTLNKQGADVGTQYRSVIFYENESQKEIALSVKKQLNAAEIWDNPIVTEISPSSRFYKAENYHQDYYSQNKTKNSYCSFVITPKLEKFRKVFSDKLK